MMNSTDPKEVLTKRLADLLGFEDGVSDVLEHLLTIESQEVRLREKGPDFVRNSARRLMIAFWYPFIQDLLEYLSQLLGQGDDNVKSFVEDAGKFRRGENVSIQNADTLLTEKAHHGTNADAGVTISNTSRQETDLKMTTLTPAKHKNGPRQNQKQQATGTSNKAANSRNMKSGKSKNDNPTLTAKSIPSSNDQAGPKAEPKQATREEKEASEPPPKSHPPRGVPSTVCGCFGTVHKPLTNCLYCGRISCHKEGFDFCPFCGLLVEKVDATPPKEG
jgi:hypothetical protein